MFSIAMFVTLLGFMHGLNGLLDGLILNRTAHVRLYHEPTPSARQPVQRAFADSVAGPIHHFVRSIKPKDDLPRLRNAQAVMQALEQDPRVMNVTPRVVAQVLFHVGTTDLNGQVVGIDVRHEMRYYRFGDHMVGPDARQ